MLNKKILTLVFVVAFLTLLVGCLAPTPPIENQAPSITSTPVTTAKVGVPYTYDVDATDPDGDTLTYSLTTNPNWMTIKSATGVIIWTPISSQVGNNAVEVMVSDGALSDTQSFTIKVTKPTPTPIPTKYYTITATVGPGGSIDPSGAVKVKKGSDKTFTITPDAPFYRLLEVLVDGGSVGVVSTYTFTNVTADHTIHANFILIGPVYNQNKDEHYETIQEAIDDAGNPGDTILVMAGVYNLTLPITVDKALTLTGDTGNPGSVIINAPTVGDDKDCFQIVADGVTIQGFRIQGAKDVKSPHNWNSGIAIGNYTPGIQNTTISFNEITNCSYGIYVYRAQYVTISNNEIWGCTADSEGCWNGKGIIVYGEGSGTQCYSIDILNNEIYENELFGIELNHWDADGEWIDVDVLIDGNTIYNNGGQLYTTWGWGAIDGYDLYRGITSNGRQIGVTITNNEVYGHSVYSGTEFLSAGIRANDDKGYTISDNDVHDNILGIYIYGTYAAGGANTGFVLTNNDVYENAQGIVVGDGDVGYANNNNIHDNNVTTYIGDGISPDGVVNLTGTVVFDATDNWWGSGGTDVNAGKPGEDGNNGVSANVGYVPWSTSSH